MKKKKFFYSDKYGWSFPLKYPLLSIFGIIGIIYFDNKILWSLSLIYLIGCVIGFIFGDDTKWY